VVNVKQEQQHHLLVENMYIQSLKSLLLFLTKLKFLFGNQIIMRLEV